MTKTIKTLAEVTRGGCYVAREDGSIVPATDADDTAVAGAAGPTAEAGVGAAVGAASGEPPPPAEDSTRRVARKA